MASTKRRKRDPKKYPICWESIVNKYEGRNSELEEKRCELQNRLDLLEKTAPQRVLYLYKMRKLMQKEPTHDFVYHSRLRIRSRELLSRSGEFLSRSRESCINRNSERNCNEGSRSIYSRSQLQSTSPSDIYIQNKFKNPSKSESKMILHQYIQTLEEEKGCLTRQKHFMENIIKDLEMQLLEIKNGQVQQNPSCNCQNNEEDIVSTDSMEYELIRTVQELKERGIAMSKRIEIMEKREAAYLETLMQADQICSDMEIGYSQHCYQAEQNEAEMRDRLQKLKKREESELRCCYGDIMRKGREKQFMNQDLCEDNHWSMFDPICSLLNRWHSQYL